MRRSLALLLALAAPLLLAPAVRAQQVEPSAEVPFELENGHIFVQVMVNGRGPYRFGFDTGASGMGRADAALTAALGLPQIDTTDNSDGVRTRRTDVVRVDRLALGPLERTGIDLLSRDYNRGRPAGVRPIEGIIGRDFFADHTVTIDYRTRTIRFDAAPLRADMPGVVAYGPGFVIPVCFAGSCHPGKVDTGSSRGLVFPRQVIAGHTRGAPTEIGRVARTNSVAILYSVPLDSPVTLSGVTATIENALYVEPSVDTINIGSDFLKDTILTIDQRNALLRIERP